MITFPRGREVVLGVGAGIAAYKSCELLRRLQDRGFQVTVIPTPASLNFVGRATWEALSGRPVRTEVWEGSETVSHVAIAEDADFVIVAPATADLIARIASGRADDLLSTTILATGARCMIVPAMHPGMYLNPATVANLQTLRDRGFLVLEPDVGRLTGADSGIGRFPETERILKEFELLSRREAPLEGKKILITAGGTIEPIDPVRFIGNRSSGRQGVAIAYEALMSGAEVTLIAGATEEFDLPGIRRIDVTTTAEMGRAIEDEIEAQDALIMSAAVADARPAKSEPGKIEKSSLTSLELVRNPDLLATAAATKSEKQVFVGFAAETGSSADIRDKGLQKLRSKSVDLLYVTDVSNGRVFGETSTSGALLSNNGEEIHFQNADKFEVARAIVRAVAREFATR